MFERCEDGQDGEGEGEELTWALHAMPTQLGPRPTKLTVNGKRHDW